MISGTPAYHRQRGNDDAATLPSLELSGSSGNSPVTRPVDGLQYPASNREKFRVLLDSSPRSLGSRADATARRFRDDNDVVACPGITAPARARKPPTVNQWRSVATRPGVSRTAQQRVHRALRVAEARAGLNLGR